MTKVCFKCKKEKDLSEFYVHKQMGDGHLNKCIECTKNDVKLKYLDNIKNDSYIEKERARGREKYHRLDYKNTLQYKKNYSDIYAGCARKLKRIGVDLNNKECHHWNYLKKDDVFIISRRAHKLIHKNIKYNEEMNCFVTNNGDVLDTREKHFSYIMKTFQENSVNYEVEHFTDYIK